jgi:hypothetical protein
MRTAIIVCLSLSILASLGGLLLLRSAGTERRYHQAQREVQRAIAESEDERFKRAASVAQTFEKTLYVNRGLGRGLVWISAGASVLALAVVLLQQRKEGPIHSPQRNAGNRLSSDDSPASEIPSSLGPRG